MKKILCIALFMGLIIPNISDASQPSSQNWFNFTNAYNWAAAKLAGFRSMIPIPSVNFFQWATDLVNRLTLDQRYTLARILRRTLGSDEQEPIKKEKQQEDPIKAIEKQLGFVDSNGKAKENFSNMVQFLKAEEDDNWQKLGNKNTQEIKCTLFTKHIYPIVQKSKTREDLLNYIVLILKINDRNINLKNPTNPAHYVEIIEKYIKNCKLAELWKTPEKQNVQKPLTPLQQQYQDYGYGFEGRVKNIPGDKPNPVPMPSPIVPSSPQQQNEYGYTFKPINLDIPDHENNLFNMAAFCFAERSYWHLLQNEDSDDKKKCHLFTKYINPILNQLNSKELFSNFFNKFSQQYPHIEKPTEIIAKYRKKCISVP